MGSQILAVKGLQEGINIGYNKCYRVYEEIYELKSGKLIITNWETKTHDLRNLELGLDFAVKTSGYHKVNGMPFLTDCATVTDCIHGIFDEIRNYRITGVKMRDSILIFNLKSELIAKLSKMENSIFIYNEKKGYLIYESDQNSGIVSLEKGYLSCGEQKSIIIYDVDSNNIKFSLQLNECLFKFVYNEARDHLVFFSGTSKLAI